MGSSHNRALYKCPITLLTLLYLLIQQYLGPPHAPPQTAATTVDALSHTYPIKSSLDTMARLKCAPKSTPYRGPICKPCKPDLQTCLIPGPVRPMTPNGIRIRSAVFPQCTGQTDRPTSCIVKYNKYAQSNLGTGPRRGGVVHGAGCGQHG